MEIFWNTIAQYNEATWWTQLLITAAGILLTTQLYRKPTLWAKTLHENLHGISERVDIHRVLHDVLRSARTPPYTRHLLGSDCSVVAMGFVYRLHSVRAQPEIQGTGGGTLCNAFPLPAPFVGTRNGISMMTTTVMPCSVAVFTIGLLLAFSRRVNLLVILFLCHWALIAFPKSTSTKIPEDLLLASATVPAIYLFFKNYFEQNLHKGNQAGRTAHELVPYPHLYSGRGTAQHDAAPWDERIKK